MPIPPFFSYTALLLLLISFGCNTVNPKPPINTPEHYTWQQFVMGSDLSYVNAVEDAGGIYKQDGMQKDPYAILKSQGNNTVRVRLWNNPSYWQAGLNNGRIYHNLVDVEKTIKRAKASGMAVNLDLHYSDDWADPQKQETPAAWKNLPLQVLKDSVYQFTLHTLNYLAQKNLIPEMIQVGNENNSGIMWPVGKVENNNYQAFATLLNAGIKAVRDFSTNQTIKPQIIIHVAQLQTASFWLTKLMQQGVTDFDIVGLSHYYKWSQVPTMQGVTDTIAKLKNLSGKKIMVVETAFPFTNQNADSYNNILYEPDSMAVGYPFTVAGQEKYFTDLTQAIVHGGGLGIMVWEPLWITSKLNDRWGTGSSFENTSFFLYDGNLHQGIKFMTKNYGIL